MPKGGGMRPVEVNDPNSHWSHSPLRGSGSSVQNRVDKATSFLSFTSSGSMYDIKYEGKKYGGEVCPLRPQEADDSSSTQAVVARVPSSEKGGTAAPAVAPEFCGDKSETMRAITARI